MEALFLQRRVVTVSTKIPGTAALPATATMAFRWIDRDGIYIRDQETGEYFSPSWNPVQKDLDHYECRHGLVYTRITGELRGIEGSTTYFVPKGKDFEVWRLLLKNKSERKRVLHVFSYAEFCFFDAIMDQQNVDWVQQIMRCEFKNDIILSLIHISEPTRLLSISYA